MLVITWGSVAIHPRDTTVEMSCWRPLDVYFGEENGQELAPAGSEQITVKYL